MAGKAEDEQLLGLVDLTSFPNVTKDFVEGIDNEDRAGEIELDGGGVTRCVWLAVLWQHVKDEEDPAGEPAPTLFDIVRPARRHQVRPGE